MRYGLVLALLFPLVFSVALAADTTSEVVTLTMADACGCECACEQNDECVAWQLATSGASKGTCWLKSTPEMGDNGASTSGVKNLTRTMH